MDREFQDVEETLKGMRPCRPDTAAMDRLLAAVEGRQETLEAGLRTVEARLAAMGPQALDSGLEARCLAILERVSHPVAEKVVPFPAKVEREEKTRASRGWWRGLAGVAAAGVISALVVEKFEPAGTSPTVAQNPVAGPAVAEEVSPALHDGMFRTGVDRATDDGVIWVDQGQAYRVVTVVFRDRVREVLPDGSVRVTEVPRVERILVKEKID